MKARHSNLPIGAFLAAVLAACGSADKGPPPELALLPDTPIVEFPSPEKILLDPCRAAVEYENELEKLRQKYSENHPLVVALRERAETANSQCLAAGVQALPSGKWLERDGVIVCDGFMTRYADQDYCAAEVPEDWVPFAFDGKLYYKQPLNGGE